MGKHQAGDSEYCERLQRAVETAFDNLGGQSKEALLFHLTHTFRIKLGGADCSSIEEIEQVLKEIFNDGATILTEWIRREMES